MLACGGRVLCRVAFKPMSVKRISSKVVREIGWPLVANPDARLLTVTLCLHLESTYCTPPAVQIGLQDGQHALARTLLLASLDYFGCAFVPGARQGNDLNMYGWLEEKRIAQQKSLKCRAGYCASIPRHFCARQGVVDQLFPSLPASAVKLGLFWLPGFPLHHDQQGSR